jgi:hypothetical protein
MVWGVAPETVGHSYTRIYVEYVCSSALQAAMRTDAQMLHELSGNVLHKQHACRGIL